MDKEIKLTDEERERIDYHMNVLLYGPVYQALEKMFKGYGYQEKYIGFLQSCVRSGEKWEGNIDDFIQRLTGGRETP